MNDCVTNCTDTNVWNGSGCDPNSCNDESNNCCAEGTTRQSQEFIAIQGQTLFTLTTFSYAVGSGALSVYVNGIHQAPSEISEVNSSNFWLNTPANAGDVVVAEAFACIENDVTTVVSNISTIATTLSDGQTIVPYAVDLTYASFYISGLGADNGRLAKDVDYSVDIVNKLITLANSYPAGTILTLVYNDVGEEFPERKMIVLETIAELRTTAEPSFAATSYIKSYYGDKSYGGGGVFLWDANSTDADDGGFTIKLAVTAGAGRWKRSPLESIDIRDYGILADDSTDNAIALGNLEAYLRSKGGGIVISDLPGIVRTSKVFICPPNVTWKVQAELLNTSITSQEDFTVFFGQCNRQDIGRSKGVEETAHDAGTLIKGATTLTVGGRWNNASGDFSNPTTWGPIVGDLCVVCTTDDTVSNPAAPIPSFTMHRKVTKVSGSIITLDKGVIGAGDYMVIPTSRNLGYDRTSYGGVGRMETIENVIWHGNLRSVQGYPFLTGGIINSDIRGQFSGRGVVFCNGLRSTKINATGYFTRAACEIALGSEDFEIDYLNAVYQDVGATFTTACFQTGERSVCGTFNMIRVSASGWNGDDLLAILAESMTIIDMEIFGSCKLRCAAIGGTASPANNFISERCVLESNGVMTGRLLETNNTENIKVNMSVTGSTSNPDAVLLRGSGEAEYIHVGTDTGVVRFEPDYLIGRIDAGGALAATSSRIQSGIVKPKKLSSYIENVTYVATYAPTQDFKMILTGAMELQDPSGTFEIGDTISMVFQQDSTGGRTLSYASGSLYRGFTIPAAGGPTDRLAITFKYDGLAWYCSATNNTWA